MADGEAGTTGKQSAVCVNQFGKRALLRFSPSSASIDASYMVGMSACVCSLA